MGADEDDVPVLVLSGEYTEVVFLISLVGATNRRTIGYARSSSLSPPAHACIEESVRSGKRATTT